MNQQQHYLPLELQRRIINFLPHTDWFKVLDVPFLCNGLAIQQLWNITNLDLFEIKDTDIPLFRACGHFIDSLEWHERSWQSHIALNIAFQSFTNVVHLDLSNNHKLTTLDFVTECKLLCHLSISNCIGIPRVNAVTVLKSLDSLMYLDISECDQIRLKDIILFSKKLKRLQYLNVRDTVSLNVETVLTVERNLIYLSEFWFCSIVYHGSTQDWIPVFLAHPKLQICPAALEVILEENPNLLQ